MKRDELVSTLDQLLDNSRFRDYCPNGLQVEGREEVRRIVAGVTASQALLDRAVADGADTVLVHHGYFWRGEEARITGIRKRRLATLIRHDLNLIAYHLPLDAHPQLGNNAQLAARLGWEATGRFGDQELAWQGNDTRGDTAADLAARLARALGRAPLLVGPQERRVRRLGWCSGGAQAYFEEAVALGLDAYVCGEISEQDVHLAREAGVSFLACGHHATERFGLEALTAYLTAQFGLECTFVNIDNPV